MLLKWIVLRTRVRTLNVPTTQKPDATPNTAVNVAQSFEIIEEIWSQTAMKVHIFV